MNTHYYIEETYDNVYDLSERIKNLKKKRYKGYRLSYNYYYDHFKSIYRLGYIWLEKEV